MRAPRRPDIWRAARRRRVAAGYNGGMTRTAASPRAPSRRIVVSLVLAVVVVAVATPAFAAKSKSGKSKKGTTTTTVAGCTANRWVVADVRDTERAVGGGGGRPGGVGREAARRVGALPPAQRRGQPVVAVGPGPRARRRPVPVGDGQPPREGRQLLSLLLRPGDPHDHPLRRRPLPGRRRPRLGLRQGARPDRRRSVRRGLLRDVLGHPQRSPVHGELPGRRDVPHRPGHARADVARCGRTRAGDPFARRGRPITRWCSAKPSTRPPARRVPNAARSSPSTRAPGRSCSARTCRRTRASAT